MSFYKDLGLINEKGRLFFKNRDLPKIAEKLRRRGFPLEGPNKTIFPKGYSLESATELIDKFDEALALGIKPKEEP